MSRFCVSIRDLRDAIKCKCMHIVQYSYRAIPIHGKSDYFRRSEMLDVLCFLVKPPLTFRVTLQVKFL